MRAYQWGELVGILFLVASTATQIFYVEPLKREIEWRLAAFNMQQNGALQTDAIYASRIATLEALKAPDAAIQKAVAERDAMSAKYKTADANIADYLFEKERVEGMLQAIVIAFFALGSLLAGVGRALEMIAAGRVREG